MIEIMCGSSPAIEKFLRNMLLFLTDFHPGWKKEILDEFELYKPTEKDIKICESYIEYLDKYKNVSVARHFLNDLPPIDQVVNDWVKTWSCNGKGDIPCQYINGPACCTVERCGLSECPFGRGFAELDRDWITSVKREFALCNPSYDEWKDLMAYLNSADALIQDNATKENFKLKEAWANPPKVEIRKKEEGV